MKKGFEVKEGRSAIPTWMVKRTRSVKILRSLGFDSAAMSMMTEDQIEQAVDLELSGQSGMRAFGG